MATVPNNWQSFSDINELVGNPDSSMPVSGNNGGIGYSPITLPTQPKPSFRVLPPSNMQKLKTANRPSLIKSVMPQNITDAVAIAGSSRFQAPLLNKANTTAVASKTGMNEMSGLPGNNWGEGGTTPAVPSATGGFLNGAKEFFGGTTDKDTGQTTPGAFGDIANGAYALWSGYNGMRAMDIAEDQYKESKRQFNANWGAQKQTINAGLADRQTARVASNAGAYMPVDQYMSKWGIK